MATNKGAAARTERLSDQTQLQDGEMLPALDGKFLVMERYPSEDSTYRVLAEIEPGEFFAEIDMPLPQLPVDARFLSNYCVMAFDLGAFIPDDEDSCTFAYRAADGRIMFQHST